MATKKMQITELGSIVMFGLSVDIHIPYNQYLKEAQNNGVPIELLPMPLNPVGAFQRSTTAIKELYKWTEEPIIVKDVESTKEHTVMRTFEKRLKSSKADAKAMESGKTYIPVYRPVITIMFDTVTTDMTYQLFKGYEAEGKSIFKEVQDKFDAICGMANIQQVRATIQNSFKAYGSIKLRGNGGVNFIPAQYLADWHKVTNFLDKFEGIDIREFDMMNSDRNRAEIQQSLADNVGYSICEEIKRLNGKTQGSKSLNELIVDFSEVLKKNQSSKDGKVSQKVLESMLNRYSETMELVKTYKELLNTDLSVIDGQIEVAKTQLMAIVEKSAA